jgi:hypothetical protein
LVGGNLKFPGLSSESIFTSFCVNQDIHRNSSLQFENVMSPSTLPADQAEAILFAQEANHYRHVTVLLFSWEDDEDGAWGEVDRLATAFEHFNFEVETPVIPREYSQREVHRHIERVERRYSCYPQDKLLILYYIGHAGMNEEGNLMLVPKGYVSWSLALQLMLKYDTGANQQRSQSMQQESGPATEPQRDPRMPPMEQVVNIATNEGPEKLPFFRGLGWRPTVNWSTVQSKVVAMPFDVLVLMHTCEAAGAINNTDTSNARGRNEIIAACPPNIYATAPPKVNTYRNRKGMTYTRTLAQILTNKARSNREFSVAELHLDMSKHMLDRMYNEGDLGHLQRLPQ